MRGVPCEYSWCVLYSYALHFSMPVRVWKPRPPMPTLGLKQALLLPGLHAPSTELCCALVHAVGVDGPPCALHQAILGRKEWLNGGCLCTGMAAVTSLSGVCAPKPNSSVLPPLCARHGKRTSMSASKQRHRSTT